VAGTRLRRSRRGLPPLGPHPREAARAERGLGRPRRPSVARPGSKAVAPAPASPAVASPAASARATPTSAAAFLGPGLVDGEDPTAHLLAVHAGDGGLGLGVAAHLDEAEPLGPPRVAVHDHLR